MTDNEKQPETGDKKDTELSIGERIHKIRKEKDLSVEQLSSVVLRYDNQTEGSEKGISVSSLYLYEKGDRYPRAKEIKLLCLALDVSADWLLFGEAWNSRQEIDSKIANALRNLVGMTDDKFEFTEKSKNRTKSNQEIIFHIKNSSES